MRHLVVDSSSLISLSSNCLLWLLDKLRADADLQLVATPEVRAEVVDKALKIERFRLGGVRVLKRFCNGTIVIDETDPVKTNKILRTANSVYKVKGRSYKIVHKAEMGLVPLAEKKGTGLMLVDERIVDKLINNPLGLKKVFERRLHMKVEIDKSKLKELKSLIGDVNTVKSSDLVAIAYEKGLLKEYVRECASKKTMKDLVSGSLWGLKKSGCSISTNDIKEYNKLLF
ncbi:hypothetical protein GF352_01085 [archaeon]|nr:hypothetical protein [archaeon]